jgi:hypothetical protein
MSYQSFIFPKNSQKKKKNYDQSLINSINNNIQISYHSGHDPESLSRSLRDFFDEEKTCRDDRFKYNYYFFMVIALFNKSTVPHCKGNDPLSNDTEYSNFATKFDVISFNLI